jgi:hypothetical protein
MIHSQSGRPSSKFHGEDRLEAAPVDVGNKQITRHYSRYLGHCDILK